MLASAPQPKHVCWHNWDDWLSVKESLFPVEEKSAEELQHALDRMQVWASHKPLPVAVEATDALIRCIVVDRNMGKESTNGMSLRLLMSAGLLRLVNGLTDTLQKKQHAQSVYGLANELDLPKGIVGIRHKSTHGQLPTLASLRSMVLQSLYWLDKNYWEAQYTELGAVRVRLTTLLEQYKKNIKPNKDDIIVTQSLRNKNQNTKRKREKNNYLYSLVELVRNEVGGTLQICQTLCSSSFLMKLPLKDSMLLYENNNDNNNNKISAVFDRLKSYWSIALKYLFEEIPGLESMFILHLIKELVYHSNNKLYDWKSTIILEWIKYILLTRMYISDTEILANVLELCIQYPTDITNIIVDLLLHDNTLNISVDDQKQIKQQMKKNKNKKRLSSSTTTASSSLSTPVRRLSVKLSNQSQSSSSSSRKKYKKDEQKNTTRFKKCSNFPVLPLGVFVSKSDHVINLETNRICTCSSCDPHYIQESTDLMSPQSLMNDSNDSNDDSNDDDDDVVIF